MQIVDRLSRITVKKVIKRVMRTLHPKGTEDLRFSEDSRFRMTHPLHAMLNDRDSCESLVDYSIARKYALFGPDLLRICPVDYSCNAKCKMCWLRHLDQKELQAAKKSELQSVLTLQDYERLFETTPPGLKYVELVGGAEPLVHPQIAELMRLIRSKGLTGHLVSNGISLTEELARSMIDLKWNQIRISINAGDRQSYKSICGVDRFDTVRKNLIFYNRLRHERNVESECAFLAFFVLQRENIETLPSIFELCEEVGADFILFEIIRPHTAQERLSSTELNELKRNLESASNRASVPFNFDEIMQQIANDLASFPTAQHDGSEQLITLDELSALDTCDGATAEHQEPVTSIDPVPAPSTAHEPPAEDSSGFVPGKYCIIGFKNAFISAQGAVQPCCFSPEHMGNIRDERFDTIWYSEKYADFRRRLASGQFSQYCVDNWCSLPEVIQ